MTERDRRRFKKKTEGKWNRDKRRTQAGGELTKEIEARKKKSPLKEGVERMQL